MRTLATYTRFAALLAAGITVAIGAAYGQKGNDKDRLAQVAELEQLHATFHGASQRARSSEWRFGDSDNTANPRHTRDLDGRRRTHRR